jgi:N-acetylmuramoyl-L-alanine amidase
MLALPGRRACAKQLESRLAISRIEGVFSPGKAPLVAVVLLLAGCATGPRANRGQVSDWESDDSAVARESNSAPAAPLVPLAPMANAGPVSAPADAPLETWISVPDWCKDNGLAAPSRLSVAPVSTYALNGPDGILTLAVGSKLAHWDGLELWLGFAPQLIGGQPCVHWLDLRKTIQPLFAARNPARLKTDSVIVIDPGHGGTDSGTKSVLANGYEKEFTLDWARRLERVLAAEGWQVLLTRNSDADLALSNRVAFAETHKADLFVSLHFNSSAPNQEQAGLETYCLTPPGLPSSMTRGYGDDLALTFANNAFDTENIQLALRVHQALLGVNGHHDRGVRRARFPAVLRGQQCPAILIEGGYLSNPREARQIADPAYRQKLAEAVAAALREKSEVRSPKSEAGLSGLPVSAEVSQNKAPP